MNRLAIETATDFCSVALEADGRVLSREQFAPRRHAELLLPWIRELLAEAGIGFADLDSLAVSRGPGGFTSLRIGLGVIQGMAIAHDLPIHPVSTLSALALTADSELRAPKLLAVIDARMSEVYCCWYETRDGEHRPLTEERVLPPDALETPAPGPWLVAGSGLASYGDAIERAIGRDLGERKPETWPSARAVLSLADQVGPVPAWSLAPVYVRDDVTS